MSQQVDPTAFRQRLISAVCYAIVMQYVFKIWYDHMTNVIHPKMEIRPLGKFSNRENVVHYF